MVPKHLEVQKEANPCLLALLCLLKAPDHRHSRE
jgi:hypothetical protein